MAAERRLSIKTYIITRPYSTFARPHEERLVSTRIITISNCVWAWRPRLEISNPCSRIDSLLLAVVFLRRKEG